MIARIDSKASYRATEEGLGSVEAEGQQASQGPIWLTSVDVAERWGLSVQTIRRYADSGKLPAFRDHKSRFSHRRFALSDCQAVLGVPKSDDQGKVNGCGDVRPVAIYARVSGSAQSKAFHKGSTDSDLARQVGRLKEYAKQHYGVEAKVWSDTGSGLSYTRKGLESLVKAMLKGELDGAVLVCEHKDRLARFGVELIQMIAKSRGIEIVFSEKAEEQSEDEAKELAADIIAILTHFSARIHGKRSAKTNAAPMDAETVKEALKMRAEGMTQSQIAKELTKRGHKNSKGRHITFHAVNSLFSKAGDILNPLVGDLPKNSVEEWGEENLIADPKARKNKVKTFHKLYVEWATARGKTPASWEAMRRYLSGRFDSCIYRCKKVYHCRLKS